MFQVVAYELTRDARYVPTPVIATPDEAFARKAYARVCEAADAAKLDTAFGLDVFDPSAATGWRELLSTRNSDAVLRSTRSAAA